MSVLETATFFAGSPFLVGSCIEGGIIYAALEKVPDALNKQK